ncbi:hypothetical protein NKH18_12930 [Streptomyces sp. M10(2022)]
MGSDEDAVHLVLKDTDPTRVISKDPWSSSSVPRTRSSPPRALVAAAPEPRAQPSPGPAVRGGANAFDMDVTVAIRPYI